VSSRATRPPLGSSEGSGAGSAHPPRPLVGRAQHREGLDQECATPMDDVTCSDGPVGPAEHPRRRRWRLPDRKVECMHSCATPPLASSVLLNDHPTRWETALPGQHGTLKLHHITHNQVVAQRLRSSDSVDKWAGTCYARCATRGYLGPRQSGARERARGWHVNRRWLANGVI
jgi:hypothetical protein